MSTKRTLLVAAVAVAAVSTVVGGGIAMADEPPEGVLYTCDALTSASVPTVKKQLAAQGIDPATVTGPVGLSCKSDSQSTQSTQDGVRAGVTGVDALGYTCASAEEKSRKMIVFFVDCAN